MSTPTGAAEMRGQEPDRFTLDGRAGTEPRSRATRKIDCGDGMTTRRTATREPGSGLPHAAFALARNGPKFGSTSRSLGEQHQAI
jgi:hypothetical protein